MDELQLIRSFRADVPVASHSTRRHARELLAAQFDRPSRFWLPLLDRRRLLICVAAALLAGLLAGSAFAFGGRFLDFIRGEPAPKPVRHQFQFAFGPKPSVVSFLDPKVVSSRIHGVLAFRTQQGPVALWAAPTRDGSVCLMFRKLRPRTLPDRFLFGACVPRGVPGGQPLDAETQTAFAWGVASKNIVRVEVHLANDSLHHNSVRRANVYEHFFAVGVVPGSTLAYAVGFDARGRKVGTYRPGPPPGYVPPPPTPAPTGLYRPVFNALQRSGAVTHRVVFEVAPAAGGGLCSRTKYTGQPEGGPSPYADRLCSPHSNKAVQLLEFSEVGPPLWGFLIGRARAGAASVKLRFEDGTSTALRLTPDRFFLAFLSGRRTLPGHRALELIARDRAGRVLGKLRLDRPPGM